MKGFDLLRATLHEQEVRRVIGLPGEGDRVVDGLAPIGATEDRCLYFINTKITDSVRESLAACHSCIVITRDGSSLSDVLGDSLVLESADPRQAVARILQFIRAEARQPPWIADRNVAPDAVISPLAVVGERVEIGTAVTVEPFCVVDDDVKIGCGSILRSGTRVYSRVAIGEETFVGANAVLGHEGYGFVRDERGNKTRIPHLGGVVIGSHVDIGALSTVPSGTIVPTTIEDYAKIDDHVHVGHNVRIARGASVTAAVVIGGHAVIDEEAWIGINSSIRDGRRVGSQALVGMDVSLQQDLDENSVARAPRPDIKKRPDHQTAVGFSER